MSKVIYKYKLELNDAEFIQIHQNAKILKVGFQGLDLFIWALVDTSEFIEQRTFAIVGTGNPIQIPTSNFIDTVFDPRGFVWHIFELVQ